MTRFLVICFATGSRRRAVLVLAAWCATAIATVALARGLPARSFFVGDPGVKLIAAQNAIARPARPFEIPLPVIGSEPVPYVDPFFIVHGDHSHAVTSALFPAVSAPFIAAFGLRGAYVLPAAGLLSALAACAWLALRLDTRRNPAVVVMTVFLATPLLFYGLEFWEHALAAGIAALATVVFVGATSGAGPSFSSGAISGVLFGIAALLRPEALWFGVAVLACRRLLPSPPRLSAVALAIAGMVVALLPLEIYTLWHFGSLSPPHIAGNPAIVSGDWLAIRASVLSSWFATAGTTSFWAIAPAILLAFVPVPISHAVPQRTRRTQRLGPGRKDCSSASSAVSLPARTDADAWRGGRRFLLAVALLHITLVVLTAPNNGGGQWAPRYLLLAYLPLAILAADTISYVASDFSRIFQPIALGAAACLLLGSTWIQRASYKELRDAKLTYARLVDFVEREVGAGGYAVTDLWWLDQVAASLTDTRHFYYLPSAAAADESLRRLADARVPAITVVRSRVESADAPESWLRNACYGEAGRSEIPERTLMAIRLSRSCGP